MSVLDKSVGQYIAELPDVDPQAKDDLSQLMSGILGACKQISRLVSRSSILGLQGEAASHNVQGEQQKKLDIICNDVMIEHLQSHDLLAGMVSEEVESHIILPDRQSKGRYLLCFDPLDGSSNIDNNFSVGSIFSLLRCPEGVTSPVADDFLQPGTQQIGAGFCVYGPATMLIMTLGSGVHAFTLDEDINEFVLTQANMTIAETTSEFAINMSNQRFWEAPVQRYIDECLQGSTGVRQKNFNMRWNASMVAEVYRILVRGGIFLYPLASNIAGQGGKLRLLYEANPMSFIIEQAGGASSTGYQRIVDINPTDIHQRVPVVLGSKQEVERVVAYHQFKDKTC